MYPTITKEQVLLALGHVEEPDLKKDLVTLNMIEDIRIEGKKVAFSVILTTPACPLKALIENACRNAILHFVDKEAEVFINMTSRVSTKKSGGALPNIRNIILVASGKGGVGKSTVSVNLALALAQSGARTGLIDADIYGPSIPVMFGLEGAKPQATRTDDGKARIWPIEKYGIKLLSIGFFTDPEQPVPWRGPMVSTAVKQLFNDADWGELDYLVVDLPPGTGDIQITLAQTYPVAGAVIVTSPQQVALSDVKKGIGMFMMNSINIPILGIVENMAWFSPAELPENKYYIFGKGGGQELSDRFDVPLLAQIPLIQGISESGDAGLPVMADPQNPLAATFRELAQKVAQQVSIANTITRTEAVAG